MAARGVARALAAQPAGGEAGRARPAACVPDSAAATGVHVRLCVSQHAGQTKIRLRGFRESRCKEGSLTGAMSSCKRSRQLQLPLAKATPQLRNAERKLPHCLPLSPACTRSRGGRASRSSAARSVGGRDGQGMRVRAVGVALPAEAAPQWAAPQPPHASAPDQPTALPHQPTCSFMSPCTTLLECRNSSPRATSSKHSMSTGCGTVQGRREAGT